MTIRSQGQLSYLFRKRSAIPRYSQIPWLASFAFIKNGKMRNNTTPQQEMFSYYQRWQQIGLIQKGFFSLHGITL